MCECPTPEKVGYSTLNNDGRSWIQKMYQLGMTIDDRIARLEPLGQFCATCSKPIGYTIMNAVRVCDGCGTYYVPKPAVGTYPIRHFLCEKCDVPTRKSRRIK